MLVSVAMNSNQELFTTVLSANDPALKPANVAFLMLFPFITKREALSCPNMRHLTSSPANMHPVVEAFACTWKDKDGGGIGGSRVMLFDTTVCTMHPLSVALQLMTFPWLNGPELYVMLLMPVDVAFNRQSRFGAKPVFIQFAVNEPLVRFNTRTLLTVEPISFNTTVAYMGVAGDMGLV